MNKDSRSNKFKYNSCFYNQELCKLFEDQTKIRESLYKNNGFEEVNCFLVRDFGCVRSLIPLEVTLYTIILDLIEYKEYTQKVFFNETNLKKVIDSLLITSILYGATLYIKNNYENKLSTKYNFKTTKKTFGLIVKNVLPLFKSWLSDIHLYDYEIAYLYSEKGYIAPFKVNFCASCLKPFNGNPPGKFICNRKCVDSYNHFRNQLHSDINQIRNDIFSFFEWIKSQLFSMENLRGNGEQTISKVIISTYSIAGRLGKKVFRFPTEFPKPWEENFEPYSPKDIGQGESWDRDQLRKGKTIEEISKIRGQDKQFDFTKVKKTELEKMLFHEAFYVPTITRIVSIL